MSKNVRYLTVFSIKKVRSDPESNRKVQGTGTFFRTRPTQKFWIDQIRIGDIALIPEKLYQKTFHNYVGTYMVVILLKILSKAEKNKLMQTGTTFTAHLCKNL